MNAFIQRRLLLSMAVFTGTLLFPANAAHAQPAGRDNLAILWDEAALNAVRITPTTPPVAARALAILHTCMFDAWAAYDDVAQGTRLGGSLRRPRAEHTIANKEQAVSYAAYRALEDLFPGQAPTNMDPLMDSLGFRTSDQSEDVQTPVGIGNRACAAVLEFRHRDGANELGDQHSGAYSDYTGFTPANTAEVLNDQNRWQPLLINGVPQRWLLPQWSLVVPFALISGAQFRSLMLAQGPALYPSPAYWKQALDVVELSAHLGDREKVIAEYWADGLSTVTPPGHWMVIAQHVSRRDHHSLDQDVKLFFILGNTLMDASIAAWDVKRSADLIRPVTVVRRLLSYQGDAGMGRAGTGNQKHIWERFPELPAYACFCELCLRPFGVQRGRRRNSATLFRQRPVWRVSHRAARIVSHRGWPHARCSGNAFMADFFRCREPGRHVQALWGNSF